MTQQFNSPGNYILRDIHCSVFCRNNFKCNKPSTCKEAVSNVLFILNSYCILSVCNNHYFLHFSTITVYLMEVISLLSSLLHAKKLYLKHTRIQYQYSYYILGVSNNYCFLHSSTIRVYLMQRFYISQTQCEREIRSCQCSVVKFEIQINKHPG